MTGEAIVCCHAHGKAGHVDLGELDKNGKRRKPQYFREVLRHEGSPQYNQAKASLRGYF